MTHGGKVANLSAISRSCDLSSCSRQVGCVAATEVVLLGYIIHISLLLYFCITEWHYSIYILYINTSRATQIIHSTSMDLASFWRVHSRGTSGGILVAFWWYPGTFPVVPEFFIFISYRIPPPSRIEGSGHLEVLASSKGPNVGNASNPCLKKKKKICVFFRKALQNVISFTETIEGL